MSNSNQLVTLKLPVLLTLLEAWDTAYYDQGDSPVEDSVYDAHTALYNQMTGLKWLKAGSLGETAHVRIMGTQAKTHSIPELADELGGPETLCVFEPKIDGLGLELSYAEHNLHRALSRGKRSGGVSYGELVTDKSVLVSNVPPAMTSQQALTVRGEVYLPANLLAEANAMRKLDGETPFKNPRNAAAGIFRKGERKYMALLRFVAYKVFSTAKVAHEDTLFNDEASMLMWLEQRGFETPPHFTKRIDSMTHENLQDWLASLNLAYETDGVVVTINDWALQRQLGHSTEYPRYSRAYKFGDIEVETTLTAIHWEASRTGRIVPKYVFEPVELEGATVTQATGHNLANLEKLGVLPGDTVTVFRANLIIPQVKGVVAKNASRQFGESPVDYPETCPSCGEPASRNEVDLLCPASSCKAKLIGALQNLCGKKGLDVDGMGEALATALVTSGAVQTLADFMGMTPSYDLQGLTELVLENGQAYGGARATTLLENLKASRLTKPWPVVLHALGCPGLGEPECKAITEKYSLADLLRAVDPGENCTAESSEAFLAEFEKFHCDLLAIKGLGQVTVETFVEWLTNNGEWLYQVSELDYNLAATGSSEVVVGPLTGKSVVVTGTLSVPRGVIEKMILDAGGTVGSSVSKLTSMVVAGDSAGSKIDKATKLGIPVLDEAGLRELLS